MTYCIEQNRRTANRGMHRLRTDYFTMPTYTKTGLYNQLIEDVLKLLSLGSIRNCSSIIDEANLEEKNAKLRESIFRKLPNIAQSKKTTHMYLIYMYIFPPHEQFVLF